MKLYATVLGILVMQVACLPMDNNPYITNPYTDEQWRQLKLREYYERQTTRAPNAGDVLGKVGETILGVGTGLLGLKAGVQHGVQAGRLLNFGNWGYDYEPGYGNWYYGPEYGNGYYGPTNNNGYFGPVPNNGPGNNGGYGGGPDSSCRTPQGTPC